VDSIHRHIGEPGSIAVAGDEVDGGIGKNIRGVLAGQIHRFRAATHVHFAAIGVLEVMDVARAKTEELVEAAFCGTTAGGKPDVPLAETAGRIARRFQVLGNQTFVMCQPDAVPVFLAYQLVHQSVAPRIPSGQQRAARGRAAGGDHIEIRTASPFRGKPVQVGSQHIRVSVTAKVAVPQVVHVDQQDVGPAGSVD
jgi:hypothetical protein